MQYRNLWILITSEECIKPRVIRLKTENAYFRVRTIR